MTKKKIGLQGAICLFMLALSNIASAGWVEKFEYNICEDIKTLEAYKDDTFRANIIFHIINEVEKMAIREVEGKICRYEDFKSRYKTYSIKSFIKFKEKVIETKRLYYKCNCKMEGAAKYVVLDWMASVIAWQIRGRK
jgi:putative component of membrane protein insertase Oxa1/YidC/SpoIIIJ protein YidD